MGEPPSIPTDDPTVGRFCPDCGYDLRGISSDRCPECGHAVDPTSLAISIIPWTHRRSLGRSQGLSANRLDVDYALPKTRAGDRPACEFCGCDSVSPRDSRPGNAICNRAEHLPRFRGWRDGRFVELPVGNRLCDIFVDLCLVFLPHQRRRCQPSCSICAASRSSSRTVPIAISHHSAGRLAGYTDRRADDLHGGDCRTHRGSSQPTNNGASAPSEYDPLDRRGRRWFDRSASLRRCSYRRPACCVTPHTARGAIRRCWVGLPIAWATLAGIFSIRITLPPRVLNHVLTFLSFHLKLGSVAGGSGGAGCNGRQRLTSARDRASGR